MKTHGAQTIRGLPIPQYLQPNESVTKCSSNMETVQQFTTKIAMMSTTFFAKRIFLFCKDPLEDHAHTTNQVFITCLHPWSSYI